MWPVPKKNLLFSRLIKVVTNEEGTFFFLQLTMLIRDPFLLNREYGEIRE